jgi:hypothetical protein
VPESIEPAHTEGDRGSDRRCLRAMGAHGTIELTTNDSMEWRLRVHPDLEDLEMPGSCGGTDLGRRWCRGPNSPAVGTVKVNARVFFS